MFNEVLGSILIFGAGVKGSQLVHQGLSALDSTLSTEENIGTVTKEKVAKVAANIFAYIGKFCAAIAVVLAGIAIVAAAPEATLWVVCRKAMASEALPWLIGSISSFASSLILQRAAK